VPPGSGTDKFARIIGERMENTLGQSLKHHRRGRHHRHRARGAPDGYTLSVGNVGTHTLGLLGAPRHRPRRRATEQGDELASLHLTELHLPPLTKLTA
jgi:hypothetical protein